MGALIYKRNNAPSGGHDMKNTATVCGPVRRQTALMVGVFLSALLTASHANAEEMIKNQGFEGADLSLIHI